MCPQSCLSPSPVSLGPGTRSYSIRNWHCSGLRSGERGVGTVDLNAIAGRVLDRVSAEPANTELSALDTPTTAIDGQVLDLHVGSDDPEDRIAVKAIDDGVLASGSDASDREVGEVIDSNSVLASADHPDGVITLGIQR